MVAEMSDAPKDGGPAEAAAHVLLMRGRHKMGRAYSVKRVAEEYDIDPRAIKQMVAAGRLHAFPISKTLYRIPVTALTPDAIDACRSEVVIAAPRGRLSLADQLLRCANRAAEGHVYFITCGEFVKVGYSRHPKLRLAGLGYNSPFDLELIGTLPGDVASERAAQARLARFHHRYEWFRLTPLLRYAIEEACRG